MTKSKPIIYVTAAERSEFLAAADNSTEQAMFTTMNTLHDSFGVPNAAAIEQDAFDKLATTYAQRDALAEMLVVTNH